MTAPRATLSGAANADLPMIHRSSSHYRRSRFALALLLSLSILLRVSDTRAQAPRAQRSGGSAAACDTVALGTLTGDVTRLDGSPAADARVSVVWNDVSVATDGPRVVQQAMALTAPTTAGGVYRACNIPLATTLLVTVTSTSGSGAALLRTAIDTGTVRFLDLVLGDGSTRTITGRVFEATRRMVSGAQLSVTGLAHAWTTDASGSFRIPDVPTGTRTIEVLALGYEPHPLRVDVGTTGGPIEIDMSHRAVLLDSVKTVAEARNLALSRYRPFENRRQNGFGYFMTEKQIADMHVLSTDEIMRRVPSVAVMLKHSRFGDSLMVVSRRGRTSLEKGEAEKPVCILDVFIDGRRSDASDIQQLTPSEIHGIEVHGVATTPVEYHAGQCGAVLIWTK